MLISAISKRYSEALFMLASEKDSLTEFKNYLILLENLLTQSKIFKNFLLSPISKTIKKEIIKKIFPEFPLFLHNFIYLIIDKRRENYLENIILEFKKLTESKKGIISPEVYLPFSPQDELLNKIKETLEKIYHKTIQINLRIDPDLIGGIKIKIQDKLIDGSFKYHLNFLKEKMTH
ncbi:MAG: ATP synthase F1 subunit delta [Armatimonadetes bacterium]|nr:ATP synthase F1 subunit delta [Armatimonadota bacterium]